MRLILLSFALAASAVAQITPVSGTLQSAAVASGNGTALSILGLSSAVMTVNCAACSGGTTVNFEASEDGSNFTSITAVQVGTLTLATSTTTSGVTVWEMPIANFQSLRARVSAYSAGTVTVTAHASINPYLPKAVAANLTMAGTAVDGNSGSKSAQTLRVALATDQPQLTNKLLVTPDANSAVNVAQINGVTPLMGNGASGTGSQRVNPATDTGAIANWGHGATGGAVPSGATYIGGNGSGNLTGLIVCDSTAVLDMTTATTTQMVALSSGKIVYICQVSVQSNGTSTVTLKYGTGSNCGTGTTALGPAWDFTAQTGISEGSGIGRLYATTASQALCATSSGAVNVHVHVSYTQF